MDSLIDKFFLISFVFNQLWQILKLFKQYSQYWFSSKIWSLFVFSAMSLIMFLELIKSNNLYNYLQITKIQNTLMGLSAFSMITLVSLGLIKNLDSKKIKTLWRLPLIGALLGYYLQANHLLMVIMGVELMIAILIGLKKNEYRYYYLLNNKSLIYFLILVVLYLMKVENNWIFFILFGFYYYYKVIILNTVTLSQWIKYIQGNKRNC